MDMKGVANSSWKGRQKGIGWVYRSKGRRTETSCREMQQRRARSGLGRAGRAGSAVGGARWMDGSWPMYRVAMCGGSGRMKSGIADEDKAGTKTVVTRRGEGRREITKCPLPERALVMSHAATRSRLVLHPGRLGRGATMPDGGGRESAQD